MTKGTYVRVEKLRSAPGRIPACPPPCHAPGVGGVARVADRVWMEGYLICDIGKGGTIHLDRRMRQGVSCRGVLRSTRIWAVSAPIMTTLKFGLSGDGDRVLGVRGELR